jgi:penicillin amidase
MMARIVVSAAERRRLPVFLRIAAGLVIGLLIAAIIGAIGSMAWLKGAMREQMPVLDGNLQLPGLSAPVLVRRDVHGIPHIQAATMDDLVEAQGFVVAQDRLWQMDMARRFAAGELAELLGSSVV